MNKRQKKKRWCYDFYGIRVDLKTIKWYKQYVRYWHSLKFFKARLKAKEIADEVIKEKERRY